MQDLMFSHWCCCDFSLVGCDAVLLGEQFLTFQGINSALILRSKQYKTSALKLKAL